MWVFLSPYSQPSLEDWLWPQACFCNLLCCWLRVQRTKLLTQCCKPVFVNGDDVFPLNVWHISPLRAKQLPHLKEPRKAFSQGYYNDIWATSNISSSVDPSRGQTETERKRPGIKLLFVQCPKIDEDDDCRMCLIIFRGHIEIHKLCDYIFAPSVYSLTVTAN